MSNLNFDVFYRDHGAQRGFKNLGATVDQTHGKFGKLQGGLGKFGGVAKAGGIAAAAGLALGAGAAVKFGFQTAMANERAKISFTTMLGSAQKAERFLQQLKDFAAKTPFEFPELQQASQRLLAIGVTTKEIIPIMTTLGNVTSGMGTGAEGIQRAMLALQQMNSIGKITAEDLNQLNDAGLTTDVVFKAIAAQTGQSTKKLAEMRDAGTLGRRELEALMDSLASGRGFEKFNGLMDKQSKSLEGMLSTLKDTFGQGMADALQGALPFIKGAIGAVTKAIGNLFSWVATHQEDMVVGFINTGDAVLGLARTFLHLNAAGLNALASIADGLATVLEGFDKLPGAGDLSGSVSALRTFGASARGAGNDINNKLIPKIDEAHSKWTKFGKDQRTQAALRDANQKITRAVERTTDSLRKNGKTLDTNSEKGRNNRAALKNLADANLAYINRLRQTDASTKKVDRATDNARQSFIKTAMKMGATSKEAKELADRFGLVDRKINALNNKTVRTKVTFSVSGSGFKIHIPNTLAVVKNMGGAQPGPRSIDIGGDKAPLTVTHSHGGGPTSGGPVVHPQIATNNFPDPGYTGRRLRSAATGRILQYGTDAIKANRDVFMQNALTSPSGSYPSYSANQAATIARMRAAGARSFTTYPGHHPSMARARDVTPHNWRLANIARASSGVWYVIYQMRIASKNHGNTWRPYHPTNYRGDWQHRRHIHVAWYDRGGLLRPGLTLAYNGTGRNERVVPAGRGGGGTTVVNQHFHFDRYVGSRNELIQELVNAKRAGRLDVVLR